MQRESWKVHDSDSLATFAQQILPKKITSLFMAIGAAAVEQQSYAYHPLQGPQMCSAPDVSVRHH